MKKTLLLPLFLIAAFSAGAQCVYTCSNYIVSPITYSTFPQGTTNVAPTLTTQFGAFSADDGATGWIPIGFPFNFFCTTHSFVSLCSNGFIIFDSAPLTWPQGPYVHNTQNIPNSAEPNDMIAFNMTDLNLANSGSLTYTTIGTAPNRMFVVTYSDVPCFSNPSNLNNGQIVLYETTSIIEIHTGSAYGDANQSANGYCTQGIENSTGTLAVTPPGRNASGSWNPGTNTAYRFTAVGPTPPAAITGNTVMCQGDVENYLITSSPGATMYTWSAPGGWTGTSTTSAVTFTSGVTSGNLSVTASYTCGTSAPSTLAVLVNPAPAVSIQSVSPGFICAGVTVTFDLAGAATYTMDPGNIVGTSPLFDTPQTSTTYSVTGTSSAGCISQNTAQVNVNVTPTPTVTINSGSICLGETFTFTFTGATNYTYATTFPQITPTSPGMVTYTVLGEANGCTSSLATSTVDVYALPTVSLTSPRNNICKGESASLTASGASTYSWSNSTFTTAAISVTPVTTTIYSVTGKSAQGCSNTASITVKVTLCNGVSSATSHPLKLYPNPASRELSVESELPMDVVIYDVLGREMKRSAISSGITTIDVSALSPGRYVLKSATTTGSEQFIFIKE